MQKGEPIYYSANDSDIAIQREDLMLSNPQSQNFLNCVKGKPMDRHAQVKSDLIKTLQNSKFESPILNRSSSVLSSSGKGISIGQFHTLRDQELAKFKTSIKLDNEHE